MVTVLNKRKKGRKKVLICYRDTHLQWQGFTKEEMSEISFKILFKKCRRVTNEKKKKEIGHPVVPGVIAGHPVHHGCVDH